MEARKMQEELDAFKKHLVLQFSLREVTIKGHLGNIRRMINQLQTTNPEKEEVTNYVYELRNMGKSVTHQCNNISSIEKYMDFNTARRSQRSIQQGPQLDEVSGRICGQ